MPRYVSVDLPIFASLLIAASAVLSLVAIIAIYREGGILKRLRATPLRPHTILTAHVLVKLLFTAITLAVMVLAGRRYYPVGAARAARVVHARAALQHGQHPVARLPHRQHRADGALRAADRHADPLSDARPVRAVRADRVAAAARCRSSPRVLPLTYAVSLLQRHLARRRLARPRRGRRDARGAVPGLHRHLGAGLPLGVTRRDTGAAITHPYARDILELARCSLRSLLYAWTSSTRFSDGNFLMAFPLFSRPIEFRRGSEDSARTVGSCRKNAPGATRCLRKSRAGHSESP